MFFCAMGFTDTGDYCKYRNLVMVSFLQKFADYKTFTKCHNHFAIY